MKKYFLLVILMLAAAAYLVSPANSAIDKDARALLDKLYTSGSQLPVRDLIMDADLYMKIKENPYAPSSVLKKIYQYRLFYLAPNKLRVDALDVNPQSPVSGMLITVIRDGKNTYKFVPYGDMPVGLGLDKPEMSNYLPFYIQKFATFNDYKYVYLGQEKEETRVLDVVGMVNVNTDYQADTTKVWIDTEKLIPAKVEYTKLTKDKKDTYTKRVTYTDVRKLPDGRYWPFKIITEELNKNTDGKFAFESTLIYQRVGVNLDLDPSLFTPLEMYVGK